MNRRRDLAAVGIAVVVIVAIGALVIAAVLDAQHAGRRRLGQLQVAQIQQLARSMDTRVKQAYDGFQGLVSGHYHATLRDPADAARLQQLQALNPQATTGYLLVDRNGAIVNGTLLRDKNLIGTTLARPDLKQVLQGKPAFLDVAPGATTVLPTIALGYPLKTKAGVPYGAFLAEVEVSPTAQFNQEVAPLAGKQHADFAFIDSAGNVIASNQANSIGHPLNKPLLNSGYGLFRTHGDVAVVEPVSSAGWRAVFFQPRKDFEGSLTSPLRSALVYIALLTIIVAGLAAGLVLRRLSRAREEQRRLNRISAEREEFISIVSHELRTPVSGLLGFLQTTLDHWDDMQDPERRRAVSRAWANASRLYSLSRDVLDSSSLETGHLTYNRETIDFGEVVSTTTTAARELAPERTINLTIPDQPVWIEGDADRLQQVLDNLLDNAVKSSPPDGPIEITLTADGAAARLTVHDGGPGLSPDDLDRAFDKFVRGRGQRTVGTGLGLYISRQIVEAHGGSITGDNSPDGGAVFTVGLPTAPAPAQPVGR
jgi:signal transduction histidine kinase